MNYSQLLDLFKNGLHDLQLALSSEQQAQCIDYLLLLEESNRVMNLSGIRELDKMVGYHLLDSLSALPHITGQHILDMGTGAGLPGIPLAIALPHITMTLCDSTHKKTRFLSDVIERLSLPNISVVNARVEQYAKEKSGEYFDAITCRAVADLPQLWKWAKPLLSPNGKLYAWKGQYPESAQLEKFKTETVTIQALTVPQIIGERHLVTITQ